MLHLTRKYINDEYKMWSTVRYSCYMEFIGNDIKP